MDPISITLLLVSTGLSIFGGVKQNQAVKAQGQKAVEDQAAANLVAAYEGEADTIAKRTALQIETARVKALAHMREKQYQQLKLAGLSLLCIIGIGLVIKNLKSE